jgi:DNA helicase-2/ATP-dependent DNA helicase PcrA
MKERLVSFRSLLARIKEASERKPPSELVRFILAETGQGKALKESDAEGEERLENIRELASFAARYDREGPAGVLHFLTDAALASDQDELMKECDAVKLLTVHASKGLEFDCVFITGLEEDLFPHRRLSEEALSGAEAEEERRLFYVAVTRARKKVILSYAGSRLIFGMRQLNVPSEFIFDVPEESLEEEIALYNRSTPSKTIHFD